MPLGSRTGETPDQGQHTVAMILDVCNLVPISTAREELTTSALVASVRPTFNRRSVPATLA